MIAISVFESPFDAALITLIDALPGESIAEFIARTGIAARMQREPIAVRVGGKDLLQRDYEKTRVSDDVTLHVYPQGAAAALWVIGGGLLAAGFTAYIDSMMDRGDSAGERSPTYDINARGNTARLGQPKPVFYGRMRTYPDLGANPYVEYDVNGDQVLYQLFEVRQGLCDIAIADMRFEDTPLTSFQGYEVEVIPPGERSKIYPGAVIVSGELDNLEIGATPNDYGSFKDIHDKDSPPDASYFVCDIGQTVTRIAVDVAANGGLFRTNDEGKIRWRRVGVRFEARKVNDANQPIGGWFVLGSEQLSSAPDNYRNAVRKTFSYSVPAGRYEVRPVRTVTKTNSHYVSDSIHWVGLKGFLAETLPLVTTTRIALKIRASEQLSNRGAGKFNCVSIGKISVWHPQTGWAAPQVTANPAWVFADIARNCVYGGGRSDAYLDLPGLYALAQIYDAANIEFNGGFDTQTTVWEALKRVAAVGYAKPVDRAGVYYMVRDTKAIAPAYMFTHSNIVKDSFKIEDAQIVEDTPDAYQITFIDADQGYRESSVLCALPGSAQQNIREEKLFGVTDKDQVYKLGMYMAATQFYRRRRIEFETGIEGYLPFFWDTISFSHYLIGREGAKQISGDVVEFDGVDLLTLSEFIGDFDSPYIVLRNRDGSPASAYPVAIVGYDQVRILQAFDASPLVFEAGLERPHFMLGEGTNFYARIKIDSIKPRNNNTYLISGFIDSPEVYDVAEGLPTPPVTQLPPMLDVAPMVVNLRAVLAGTLDAPEVLLRWDSRNADYFLLQMSTNNGADWTIISDRHYDNYLNHNAPVEAQIVYRVCGVNVLQGQWAQVSISASPAAYETPAPVTGLALREPFIGTELRIKWVSNYTRHKISFLTGGDEKYSIDVTGEALEFNLSAAVARSNGLGRSFTVRIWSISQYGKVAAVPADLVISNPPPGQPANLSVTQSLGTAYVTYDLPNDSDFAGVSVWASPINNFSPSADNLIADRALGRSVSFEMPNEVLYVRVAALDIWGDDYYISAQYTLDPLHAFDRLAQQIKESHLHQSLLGPIQKIDGPGGLVEKTLQSASDIISEANARLALAQQLRGNYAGNDLSQVETGLIKQERTERENRFNQLSSQMALLTAGNANQFDHVAMWYFDNGVEGWTSDGGAPTIQNPGWLKPFPQSDTTAISPLVSIDGTKYTQVRARIRKVGSPASWKGSLYFTTTSYTSYAGVRRTALPLPAFDASGIALLTWEMSSAPDWIGSTITHIRADLGQATTSTDFYEIDWIAVGRPAPGASSAELFEEQIARVAQGEAFASDLALANAAIAGKANQSAVDSLSINVSELGDAVNAMGIRTTALESQVDVRVLNANSSFADWTGTAPAGWDFIGGSSYATKHTGAYAYSGGKAVMYSDTPAAAMGIGKRINGIDNPEYIDVELIFTLVSGGLNGVGIQVSWTNTTGTNHWGYGAIHNAFNATDILGKKTTHKVRIKRPTNFSGTFNHLYAYVFANSNAAQYGGAYSVKTIVFDRLEICKANVDAKALEVLESRVTASEDNLSSQSNQLTQLNNDVAGKASATALTALQNTVTSQGGQISAANNAVTQLQSSIPGGGNLIPHDTEFMADGLNGWSPLSSTNLSYIAEKNLSASGGWKPDGVNTLGISHTGTSPSGYFEFRYDRIPVEAGQRYCFSAYVASHRAAATIIIQWWDAVTSGNAISSISVGAGTVSGGSSLSGWNHAGVFGIAPANAKAVRLYVRMTPVAGQTNPYLWFCRPMFSEVATATTEVPRYSPSIGNKTLASLQVLAETAANNAGNALARWEVKTNVNNLQGGVGFYNDGVKTRFGIHADQFSVYSPGAQSFSLITEGGKVLVDGASIKNLSVDKLVGNTANFIKVNVGTLVVDDIQGSVNDIYYSGPHVGGFNMQTNTQYTATTARQIPIAHISLPARANNRPYNIQFSVQGVASKGSAGSGTVVAEFFEPNPASAWLNLLAIPSNFSVNGNAFQWIQSYATSGPKPALPSGWELPQVGEVLSIWIDWNNMMEGTVASVVPIDSYVGPGTNAFGRRFDLTNVIRLGTVPLNGSGCNLSRRTQGQKMYNRMGITMAQTVSATTTNEEVRYNMTYYDTSGKKTTSKTILCTIAYYGTGSLINTTLDFAILAGR